MRLGEERVSCREPAERLAQFDADRSAATSCTLQMLCPQAGAAEIESLRRMARVIWSCRGQ
jgi:hypothetical protein